MTKRGKARRMGDDERDLGDRVWSECIEDVGD